MSDEESASRVVEAGTGGGECKRCAFYKMVAKAGPLPSSALASAQSPPNPGPDFRREANAAYDRCETIDIVDNLTDLARRMYVAGLRAAGEYASEHAKRTGWTTARDLVKHIEREATALDPVSVSPPQPR